MGASFFYTPFPFRGTGPFAGGELLNGGLFFFTPSPAARVLALGEGETFMGAHRQVDGLGVRFFFGMGIVPSGPFDAGLSGRY